MVVEASLRSFSLYPKLKHMMEALLVWLASLNPWIVAAILVVFTGAGSVKRVREGNEALVERLGRYHRKLSPGLHLGVVPLVDHIPFQADIREQIIDIEPIEAVTADNVRIGVDAIIFWRIVELEKVYYSIADAKNAVENIVITTLRSEIGQMTLQETNSGRDRIIRALLESLDEATEPWGVKVTRVEIQDIKPPLSVIAALEQERSVISEKRAMIERAEARKQAFIIETEAIAYATNMMTDRLPPEISPKDILNFLLVREYIQSGQHLTESLEEIKQKISLNEAEAIAAKNPFPLLPDSANELWEDGLLR
jgi:regulator of protease activity HflC (stomatin/prohibitin superfamily)